MNLKQKKHIIKSNKKSDLTLQLLESANKSLILLLTPELILVELVLNKGYDLLFLDINSVENNQPIEFVFIDKLSKILRDNLEHNNKGSNSIHFLSIYKDNKELIFEVQLKPDKHSNNTIGIITQVSQETINSINKVDGLTGLPNRNHYYSYLDDTLIHCKKNNTICGVLFFDLDRFKSINDSLGHRVGDELLIEISHALKNNLNENEFVARISGDEFTVISKNINDESEIIETANRVLSLFKTPFCFGKHALEIKVSIGISLFPNHAEFSDVLTQYADIAMYTAKEYGGNQYCLFHEKQDFRVKKNFKMEQNLRKAIDKDEIYMVYQPQYSIDTNEIIGLESLVRWKLKNGSIISPGEFIPLAELTGYINELGIWIFNDVCSQINQWKKKNVTFQKISINLSRTQLIDKDIINIIFSIMKYHKVNGKDIVIEITEESIIKNNKVAMKNLKLFNDHGIKIAIDDFGSGYSSFKDLKTFPFSELKIDKSIIDDIGFLEKNDAIVRAIISMGNEMDMKIVAEGVETNSQYEFLKNNNCHIIQGYLLGKPLSKKDIEELLTSI